MILFIKHHPLRNHCGIESSTSTCSKQLISLYFIVATCSCKVTIDIWDSVSLSKRRGDIWYVHFIFGGRKYLFVNYDFDNNWVFESPHRLKWMMVCQISIPCMRTCVCSTILITKTIALDPYIILTLRKSYRTWYVTLRSRISISDLNC